jgi:hypothetical protein
VSGVSLNRNDWLADFPLPEEGGYSLSLSGIAPQPGFRRGLEVYIPPSLRRAHASETDVLSVPNLAVLLFKRVPYHFIDPYAFVPQCQLIFEIRLRINGILFSITIFYHFSKNFNNIILTQRLLFFLQLQSFFVLLQKTNNKANLHTLYA